MKLSFFLKILLPLLAVAGIFYVFSEMQKNKPKPFSVSNKIQTLKVGVKPLKRISQENMIYSQGTIEARYDTTLKADASAKVKWVSEHFEPGTQVQKGEVLVKLDNRDAQYELLQAEVALENAQIELAKEEARKDLAEKEWEFVKEQHDEEFQLSLEEPSPLTVRLPQLALARSSVKAQKARVNRAKMLLERSTTVAPFNGFVQSRQVSPGQTVTVGTTLGRVISANALRLNLPISQESALELDSLFEEKGQSQKKPKAARVKIIYQEDKFWEGTITRMSKQIDPQTRKMQAIIDITPNQKDGSQYFRAGQFVTAVLYGKTYPAVYEIPRISLNKDKEVPFLSEGLLVWKQLPFIGNDGEFNWVDANNPNVSDGDLLITSSVQDLTNGTKLLRLDAPLKADSALKKPLTR